MSSLNNDRSTYWRSLDELARNDYFRRQLENEFPGQESDEDLPSSVSRRRFLQLLGASAALAGMTACRWEDEKILPYAARPDGTEPGAARHFASMMELGGVAQPLLVTSRDGRPNKVEGNPDHPMVRGSSSVFAQALMLGLCDPERSKNPRRRDGEAAGWAEFSAFLADRLAALGGQQGRGLAILADLSSSPTMARLRREILAKFPAARFVQSAPVDRANEIEGSRLAYGRELRSIFRLEAARRIVSLDCDLFGLHPDAQRLSRDWARGRDPKREMNRLYAIESGYSTTGACADHRLQLKPSRALAFLSAVESVLAGGEATGLGKDEAEFASALARDLAAHAGAALIAVGRHLPAGVHALAHRLNERLGAPGKTVDYIAEPDRGDQDLKGLVAQMSSGAIDTLLILGANPVYASPAALEFAAALAKVPHSVHLGLHHDETARAATWHLPMAHDLECWGDALAWDGSLVVAQPLIAPLYDGRSAIEVVALLAGEERPGRELVRTTWSQGHGSDDRAWRHLIHDGFDKDGAARIETAKLRDFDPMTANAAPTGAFELVFQPSPAVWDGRFANNGWLQELPDFMSKLTWDNALMMAAADADRLELTTGSMVRLKRGERQLDCAVYVMPGQAPGTLGLALGYGRREAGNVGGSLSREIGAPGFDAYAIQEASGAALAAVVVEKIDGCHELAATQSHHAIDEIGMKGREERLGQLIREADLEEYEKHPDFARHVVHHPELESLWKSPLPEDGKRWGMAIDLNKCVGCNACVVGCQAENNIPVVGKADVLKGREMHWIRIDRYFRGDIAAPEVVQQPVACQHCENAPCEQVCPVAATMHSHEGLNDMVYNRCVGTRYCANNCPYKVRRFNFFNYHKELKEAKNESLKMAFNPEVTVRARGVMEKCTYCVQRIASARQESRNSGRPIADGDIVSACQQACPSEAIVFGDLNDRDAAVRHLHEDSRSYALLEELNVKPRTQYLARVRNPNPELAKDKS
ncbi:MAG: TAT-variant-translocated molybdopterin oxidoreductase [Planctomycetes bacterium]|nr:TAT-variant-translocated molybdopterin oxidoreductase [Planctomycetota bacterium]